MLSKAVEVGVRECFRNHLYTFNAQVYSQTEGGPIGLRYIMFTDGYVGQNADGNRVQHWVAHTLIKTLCG